MPDTILVAKTREVCTEVVIDIEEEASASSSGGGSEDEGEFGEKGDDDYGDDSGGWGGGDDSSGGDKGGFDDRRRRMASTWNPDNYDSSYTIKERITVSVISNKKLDYETEKEVQSFTWDIISVSANEIKIKIVFEFPEVISAD